jgi:hypothetical protein
VCRGLSDEKEDGDLRRPGRIVAAKTETMAEMRSAREPILVARSQYLWYMAPDGGVVVWSPVVSCGLLSAACTWEYSGVCLQMSPTYLGVKASILRQRVRF